MHCPGHVFFADQKQFEFKEGKKNNRFHRYNDGAFGRFHKGKTADQFCDVYCRLTKAEIAELCDGDMASWVRANEPILRECYTLLSPTINYNELPEQNKFRMKEISDKLLCDAGYRLAHIVNQIFK